MYRNIQLARYQVREASIDTGQVMGTLLFRYHDDYVKRKRQNSIAGNYPTHNLDRIPSPSLFRSGFQCKLASETSKASARLQIITRYQSWSAILACYLGLPPTIILQPQNCEDVALCKA